MLTRSSVKQILSLGEVNLSARKVDGKSLSRSYYRRSAQQPLPDLINDKPKRMDSMQELHVPDYIELIQTHNASYRAGLLEKNTATAMLLADSPELPPWSKQVDDAKKAPGSTTIVAVPKGGLSDDDRQSLNDIRMLDAYISAAASLIMYKQNPKGWDITKADQAVDFTQKLANAKFLVITKGLGSVLSQTNTTVSPFNKDTTSVDFHLDFLQGLFSGFGLGDVALKQLDGILTNVANSLRDLKASWSTSSSSIDHLICFHYFTKEEGLDDVRIPNLRLFYLHIEQSSWQVSLSKVGNVDHFHFSMLYDNFNFEMTNQVAETRDDLQSYLKTFSKMGLEEMINMIQPAAISDDRRNA